MPRVLAATTMAVLLSSLVILVGIVGGYFFSVFFQDVSPGSFANSLTIITGTRQGHRRVDQGRAVRHGCRANRLL